MIDPRDFEEPWISRDEIEAPKDGSKFIAWDFVHGVPLLTVHWDEEDEVFMTDYERWSGRFQFWRPAIKSPSGL